MLKVADVLFSHFIIRFISIDHVMGNMSEEKGNYILYYIL